MVIAKKWVVAKKVVGYPTEDNFKLIEEELPACKDGDIIVECEYLTVDPYIRIKIGSTSVGETIHGFAVAKIIESKNSKYPVGSYVVGNTNWMSHAYVSEKDFESAMGFMMLPDLGDNPKSTALGILGMPGNTAYFGFLEICKPQPGDTVLVNAAAGAVGSAVCQIAKIKGCTVIAFAGSDEKVTYLKDLGIDHVFNYKLVDVTVALKQVAPPSGIQCFFDNVGGEFTGKALPFMARGARISVCGAISTYNNTSFSLEKNPMSSPFFEGSIILNELKIEGFMVYRWWNRWNEGIQQMKQWIEEGKIKYKETITEKFENMPVAFMGLLKGENIGKAIVKA